MGKESRILARFKQTKRRIILLIIIVNLATIRSRASGFAIWLLILYCLSYKLKIIGQNAERPLYILGVIAATIWLTLFFPRFKYLVSWILSTRPVLLTSILLCFLLLAFQSLLYPATISSSLYSVVPILLLSCISVASIGVYGLERTVSNVSLGLITYSLINIVLAAGVLIAPSLYQNLPVLPSESGYGLRNTGLVGDPTHLGGFFSITLLLMFVLRRKFHSLWFFIACLFIFVGLLSTGSRNSILSLFVGACLAVFASGDLKKNSKKLVYLCIGLGLLLRVLYLTIPDSEILLDSLYRISDENSFIRFNIWQSIYFVANGLNAREILFGGGFLFVQDLYGSPYNAFLRIFINQGTLFLILFISVLVQVVVLASRDKCRLRRGLVFALLGYWITFSMFLDTLFAEFFHVSEFPFWLAVSIVATSGLGDGRVPFRGVNPQARLR